MSGAHNELLDLEDLEEADLERFRTRYEALARAARDALRRGELDTRTPELKADQRLRYHLIGSDRFVEIVDASRPQFLEDPRSALGRYRKQRLSPTLPCGTDSAL